MANLYTSVKAYSVSDNLPDVPLRHYTNPDISITNRLLAWTLSLLPEDSEEVVKIKHQVEAYNEYIDKLMQIPNFENMFADHTYSMTKTQAINIWSEETVKLIFLMPQVSFNTQLKIIKETLFKQDYEPSYSINLNDENVVFKLTETDDGYHLQTDKYHLLWNWYNDDIRDITYYLWSLFNSMDLLPKYEDDVEPKKEYNDYEAYDQARYCMEKPDVNLMRCVDLLVKYGYMTIYNVSPEYSHPIWSYRCKDNGTLDVATLDKSFAKDNLLLEKIKLVLAASVDEINNCKYFLTDCNNQQYLSDKPGNFGGHKKLKIYGKLDCSSSLRYIKQGKYIKQRVFFADEIVAIKAGYRPCGVCMKEKYSKWKNSKII